MLRIGQKRPRGVLGSKNPVFPRFKNIDCSSGSMNKLVSPVNGEIVMAKELSPLKGELTVISDDGLKYLNFENWWQSQKIYPELGHIVNGVLTPKFLEWRKRWAQNPVGNRTIPETKGLCPIGSYHNGQILNYIESRTYYVLKYCQAVKGLKSIKIMVEMLKNGQNIMIIEGDGPLLKNYPEGHEFTWEFADRMIKDPKSPYGHGYVVANILYDLYHFGNLKSKLIQQPIQEMEVEFSDDESFEVIVNHPQFIKLKKSCNCKVVHIKRQGGKIVQDCTLYIGRQCNMGGWALKKSKWANPFTVKQYGLQECLKKYEQHIRESPELMASLEELNNQELGCWCDIHGNNELVCHGQILIKLLKEYLDT